MAVAWEDSWLPRTVGIVTANSPLLAELTTTADADDDDEEEAAAAAAAAAACNFRLFKDPYFRVLVMTT